MKRLLFLTLLLISGWASAQTGGPTPAQTLRLARATYEQGRLHEIPSQLNEQIISKMSKQDKVEAYKILCLTYIYLEEPTKADESMLSILQTDPYFSISEAIDPAEFVALYKTFRTRPIYRIGGRLGVGASRPNVNEVSTAGEITSGSEYKPLIGIQFGLSGDKPINDRLTIHAEILYTQKQFALEQIFEREKINPGDPTVRNKTDIIEQQTWLSLPLSVEYKPLKGNSNFNNRFNPYVAGGVTINYLLGAKIVGQQLRDGQAAIQEKTYDIKDLRKTVNISALVAMGVKTRLFGGYIVSELRYLYGITNVNSTETAYQNQDATWEISYADPTFKVSSLEIGVAYVQNIFKPKKLKRKK